MHLLRAPLLAQCMKKTKESVRRNGVRKKIKINFQDNIFSKKENVHNNLNEKISKTTPNPYQNDQDNYKTVLLKFMENMEQKMRIQIKNEENITIDLDNILPYDMPILKIKNRSELIEDLVTKFEDIYEICEFNFSDSSYKLNEIIKCLDSSNVARIIINVVCEDFLPHKNKLPLFYIKKMFSSKVIERALMKYYSSLGFFEDISKIHQTYISKICNENKKLSIQLFRGIIKDTNQDLLHSKRYFPTGEMLQEYGNHLLWIFLLCISKNEIIKNNYFEIIMQNEQEHLFSKFLLFPKDVRGINRRKIFKIETCLIPSLVPAIPIYNFNSGGYMCDMNYKLIRGLTTKDNRILNKTQYRKNKLNRFLNILSASGTVGWRINEKVFDLLLKLFLKNISDKRLGLYKYEPIEKKTNIFGSDNSNIKNTKELKEQFSLWSNLHKHIVVANSFRNKDFYLPFNIDFRGRCYPIPIFCHHYTHDSIRSLLKFSIELPLGDDGLYWLKIHLSNKIGKFKTQNFDTRIKNIDKMIDEIHKASESPLLFDWWMDCSDPWQTLAACFEISAALKSGDPRNYMCSLPIHQDGCCNGLQHYAALSRNREEAKFVNFEDRDIQEDIYTSIAKKVDQSDWKSNVKGKKEIIDKIIINRKVVKQTVMTFVYGVTLHGATKQIRSKIKEYLNLKSSDSIVVLNSASVEIARRVLNEVKGIFPDSNKIMQWLKIYASEFVSMNKNVSWRTNYNLISHEPYEENNKSLSKSEKKLLRKKQIRAFPPNFVHSQDATHMMMTFEKCIQEGILFSAVHDSFWCHPSNTTKMNEILRNQFIELYQKNSLENLRKYAISKGIKIDTPPPLQGKLNLSVIKKSPQFFS